MKRTLLMTSLLAVLTFAGFAQDGSVGIGTATPNNKAILDLFSNNKGLLMPRLTTTERNQLQANSVVNDAINGLIIYNTTEGAFNYWNHNGWLTLRDGGGTATGESSLINTVDVAPGTECSAGGIKIFIGVDTNGDGVLQSSEVQNTRMICNGEQGPAGADGATGAQGPQGPAGATGATGAQGPQGVDGRTILNGSGAPLNTSGSTGDFYIDITNNRLYGPKGTTTWPGTSVSLVGPQGPAGATGAQGPAGPQGPAGATGAQGPAGATGATGVQGPQGVDGRTILNGSGAPLNTSGLTGDFYIDITNNRLYGPKGTTTWPGTSVSLVGPAGATGATGAQGPAGATGAAGRGIASTTNNANGTVTLTYTDGTTSIISPANIYNSNGTLSADRTVTQNNNDLTFVSGANGRTIMQGNTERGGGAVYEKQVRFVTTGAGLTYNADDYIIIVTGGGAQTISLPSTNANEVGRVIIIKNSTAHVGPAGTLQWAVNPSGSTGSILSGNFTTIISDGTNWHTLMR